MAASCATGLVFMALSSWASSYGLKKLGALLFALMWLAIFGFALCWLLAIVVNVDHFRAKRRVRRGDGT